MALHITLGLVELINVGFSVAWPEKEGTVASDDIRDCDKEEIRSQFVGWEDEVQQLIEVRSFRHGFWYVSNNGVHHSA